MGRPRSGVTQGPLRLVCVLNPPMLSMWPEEPMPAEYARWQQEQGRTVLDGAREVAEQAAKDSGGVMVETEMPTGSTVPILVHLTAAAEMIAVGAHGRGTFKRRMLGSVTSGVLRHAHCPVAVIHDTDRFMDKPAAVVVGIDGSPASELATEIAFDEASRRGVDLVAVHAVSDVEVVELPGWTTPPWKSGPTSCSVSARRLAGALSGCAGSPIRGVGTGGQGAGGTVPVGPRHARGPQPGHPADSMVMRLASVPRR